jgi:hypothetical protein
MKQLNFLLQKRIPHDMPWLGGILVGPNTHNRYYYGDDIPQDPYIFLPVWEWGNPQTGMMQAFTQEPDFFKTFGASEQVIQDLRDRKAHCMINIFAEGWVEEGLMSLLTDYFKRMRIPLSQIIYSSNCANHQYVYDKLAQPDRINTNFLPQFIQDYAKHYDKSNFYKLDTDKIIYKSITPPTQFVDLPFIQNPTTFDELEQFISIYNPSETILISNIEQKELKLRIEQEQKKEIYRAEIKFMEESEAVSNELKTIFRYYGFVDLNS